MSENVGKLQIVLKGGKPWGFRLKNYSENRSTVVVDHIEPGGKAQMHGSLKVGDHVIKINDVLCLSLADAIQLIDSAFRTLTILVWRPSYCAHSNKNASDCTEPQTQKSHFLSYSGSIDKIKGSFFPKFSNFSSETAISKLNEKHVLNSSASRNDNSASLLQYQFSNFNKRSSHCVDDPEKRIPLYKNSPKEPLSNCKNYLNIDTNSNKESFISLSSESHQSANLQYICEQYPLSELFLNHKPNLKLESFASHTKKLFDSYENQEIGLKPFVNTSYKSPTCISKESNCSKISECICCMYPKCHSSYKNCKMHSPPERDLAVCHSSIVDQSVCSQYLNYKEQYKSDLNTGLPDNNSSKKINYGQSKSCLKIKEDGFKNSDLKVFKPASLSVDSKSVCVKSYDSRPEKKDVLFLQDPVSHLKSDQNKNKTIFPIYYMVNINEQQKVNSTDFKTLHYKNFPNEKKLEPSKEHVVNHSEQNKSTVYDHNTVKEETVLKLYNQHSSSGTFTKQSYRHSYLKEKEHSVILASNKDSVEYSNEASFVNVFSTECFKSDGDEDEELCLIEENARNNNSSTSMHYSPVTPDFALPPPPLNDAAEIIPSNEPLPSPPSFSPIKEVIYENIQIDKRPDEAIYANLEMLKIQCSVVNSSTQTSVVQKINGPSDVDTKLLNKRFSLVETQLFSNIIGPTYGNHFKSDYFKSFLQSQIEKHSTVMEDNEQESAEKYSVEKHTLSLPVTSAYFTTSEPKAKLLTRYISSLSDRNVIGGELTNKKDELMTSINKKLGILRLEQIALIEEMKQNDHLGNSLAKKLGKIALPNEVDKFRVHVEELEKITNLMISLSGRLARAENALLILPSDASSEEKAILEEKYSKLNKQYEEAKYLKKNIDRRSCHVSLFLRKYFTEEEFTDYDHFVTMKVKLLMDYREIDEKIKLGEEQLDALKSSVNSQSFRKITNDSQD